jgi:hypothetical protein
VQYGLRIRDELEPVRSDSEACREVAKHRAEPKPPEQWHSHDARGEKSHHRHKINSCCCCFARHYRSYTSRGLASQDKLSMPASFVKHKDGMRALHAIKSLWVG